MIGIDVVKIDRIERILGKNALLFCRKILSDDEILLCLKSTANCNETRNLQNLKKEDLNTFRVAGFFALKEAVSKALGVGICADLGFRDILIYKDKNLAPIVKIRSGTKFDKCKIKGSISHDAGIAISVAMVCGDFALLS